MQHPDHVNSTDKPELRVDAPNANGSNATDPTIFHNPSLLSRGQVGDGYRLLTKSEFENIADPSGVTEFWHRGYADWDTRSSSWADLNADNTYRVRTADELNVGARVRVIGTPWGFPNFTQHLGRVGRIESIDRDHAARYHVKVDGSDVPIWYEVGAIDRDYADGTAEPRTFRFKEGDTVVITGPTVVYDRSEVGQIGVVRVVDRTIDDGYPYRVAVGGDELNLRWFPESSLAPAESLEYDPPDTYIDEIPAQVKPAVYVSAHFPEAPTARYVSDCLAGAGHRIVSTWYSTGTESDPVASAVRDFREIDESDALVMLSTPHRTTGGKFVELGYALGKGKRVFVLGVRENWMIHHPSISVYASVEELLAGGVL